MIINIDLTIAIVTSAAVTTFYTMIGQMISVAYTDIIQLLLILFGLVCSGRAKNWQKVAYLTRNPSPSVKWKTIA